MKIQVKQEHIDKGIRGDCKACPVAFALKDALPEANVIRVESDRWVYIDGEPIIAPFEVDYFVVMFDEFGSVKWLEPFEFELDYWPEEEA